MALARAFFYAGAMRSVPTIVSWYIQNQGEFETARDEIQALDPAAMQEVLSAALSEEWSDALDLLVTCLADVQYPPALEHLRRWMHHTNIEGIALPAADALDRLSGDRFNVLRFFSGGWDELPATLQALGAWWDAGTAPLQSTSDWLAEQRARRAK